MPVITASTLKVVKPLALGDTASVIVADMTWFAAIVADSLFQLIVRGPFAVEGFQFDNDRLRVSCVLPTFLM